MNLVYVSNDGYAEHLAAGIHSAYEFNRDSVVNIFVVSVGIAAEHCRALEAIAEEYGQKLHLIDFENIRDRLDFDTDRERFNFSTFGRFFLGSLLPEAIDRCIYLDADTVTHGSLRGMWEQNLGSNVIACAAEPTIYRETKAALGLREDEPYYNAGVMLMDLDCWRRENLEGRLLEYYRENAGRLRFCDQDAINVLLKGRIALLDPKYNFFSNYYYFSYQTLLKFDKTYAAVGREAFEAAKKDPAVVHYAGDDRPWKAGCRNPYRRYYEESLAGTAWENAPKETGSEGHLMLYHGMNLATKICPPVRRAISRSYGKKLYREK